MARPRKCRKVCQMPVIREFLPARKETALKQAAEETPDQESLEIRERHDMKEAVVLTVDEYEAIRLIDKEGFSQEECSVYMRVARTTAQMIYNSARKKLAEALVDGKPLLIRGGDYELCTGEEETCGCGGCRKHRNRCMEHKLTKEDGTVKIGIPLDENKEDVCIVLARAPYFLFRENGTDTVVENPAAQAQGGAGIQVAQFLVDQGVDVLVTVRCGQNAAEVFQAADMKIYKSVNKAAADDLTALEKGELEELTHFHGGYHGIQ